jgi:isochorismate pyruvate lyase
MDSLKDPEDCTAMDEVRAGVDTIDRAVIALLKRRFAFMEAAARIKPDRAAVRDEERKADVLAKVEGEAKRLGLPDPAFVRGLYEQLVERSIAYEFEVFDRTRGG